MSRDRCVRDTEFANANGFRSRQCGEFKFKPQQNRGKLCRESLSIGFAHKASQSSVSIRMAHHVFAEVALATIGTRVEPGALDVAVLAAGDIFRRADLDIVGAAERVIVGAGIDHGRLSPLQAACQQGSDEQERDEYSRIHEHTFCASRRGARHKAAQGAADGIEPGISRLPDAQLRI